MPTARLKRADTDVLAVLRRPVWIYDLEEETIWWSNQAALELFDAASLEVLRARQQKDTMSDGMSRRLVTYREHFLRGEHVVEDWTFYPDQRDPVTASCACSGVLVGEGKRERLAMLVEATPVEHGLSSDERRLLEALRHCNERISLYAADGHALLRNPAAEQALGLVSGSNDGGEGSFASTLVRSDEAEEMLDEAMGGAVVQAELHVRTATGDAWYDTEARRVVDPVTGNAALLCMQHDVSARRASEAQLAQALREADTLRQKAEAASHAKSAFLAMMSHELRTPMAGALTAAELLRDSKLTEDQRELLAMVLEGGQQMVGLVDDVLDISRIEAGHIDVVPLPVDPEGVLFDALRPLVAAARKKGLALEHSVAALPACVHLDPRRFSQIVTNLVGNAIKFTDEGSIVVKLEEAEGETPTLRLEVLDHGIGLDEADQARLFEPFGRGRATEVRERGGAGLGLYIVQSVTRALGGRLGVESELGRGTRFWVNIPAPKAQPVSKRSDTSAIESKLALGVLVVDDNRLNRRSIARLLRSWGCAVTEAVDGLDALERIGVHHDVVLMDINMPKLDGAGAAAAIRRRGLVSACAPIVALTADVFFDVSNGPFDELVTKPIDWPALRRLLTKVSSRH